MTEVERLRVAMRRAMNCGDISEAERIAVLLAPFEDAICDELDRNPSAIVPMWGLEA